jgi:hypothetical protein
MVERTEINREDFGSTVEEKMPFQAVARVALVIVCRGVPNSKAYVQSVVNDG